MRAYTMKHDNYELGAGQAETPFSRQIAVYNIERTICSPHGAKLCRFLFFRFGQADFVNEG